MNMTQNMAKNLPNILRSIPYGSAVRSIRIWIKRVDMALERPPYFDSYLKITGESSQEEEEEQQHHVFVVVLALFLRRDWE